MSGRRAGIVSDHVISPRNGGGNRKRSRLDYLTEDEKVLRRKLLNREAAQKARDRRKNSIRLMEESIHSLQSENQSLRQTISFLKHKCQEQEVFLNSMHYQLGLLTGGHQAGKSEQIEPSDPGFVPSIHANDYGVVFQDDIVANISSEVTVSSQSTEDAACEVDVAPIVSASSLYADIYKSLVDETADVPLTPSSSADSIDEILKYLSDEDLSGVLSDDLISPPLVHRQ